MWIAEASKWNTSHTDLSKYYIERLKQKLDPSEIISNRHKTTNGITLVSEIVDVCSATLKRIKNVNRLRSLLEEAKSTILDTNVVNDYIIGKYHPDIGGFFRKLDTENLNEKLVPTIHKKSKIYLLRLETEYFQNIQTEFKSIDYRSNQFKRNADIIDKLLDCLIPYLLYTGYSITSLSEIAFTYIFKENGAHSPIRFFTHFKGIENDCEICLTIPKATVPEVKYLFEEIVAFADFRTGWN